MIKKIFSALIFSLLVFSCSYEPILDENQKYRMTPQDQIDEDIKQCKERADNHLKGRKLKKVGKQAVRGGATGAIVGGALGLFLGGTGKTLARGVGIGAGVGAVAGGASAAGEGKLSKDQIKQRYVNRCLNEKGYSVLGWE